MGILLLAFSLPLPAQAKTSPKKPAAPDFKAMMQKYLTGWESVDPGRVAPYYAKDADLAFYDIAPDKYTGWAEYSKGVSAEFGEYTSAKFTLGDDVRVHPGAKVAWATATVGLLMVKKDGAREFLPTCRWTLVWEKRGGEWLIVHEHLSVAMGTAPQRR
jgi:ketosteroid isomerase-like protein